MIGLSNVFQLLTSFSKLLSWTLTALPILKLVQLLVDLSPTFKIYYIFLLSPFEFFFAKSKFDRKFVRGTAVKIFNSGLRLILRSIGNISPSLALLKKRVYAFSNRVAAPSCSYLFIKLGHISEKKVVYT